MQRKILKVKIITTYNCEVNNVLFIEIEKIADKKITSNKRAEVKLKSQNSNEETCCMQCCVLS